MNKRKSVVDGEQAQPCKKLKLKTLDDAPDDAQALDAGTASSIPSSSAAPKASASASASVFDPVSSNAGTSKAHDAPCAPASERPNKRKAADDAESSQAREPKKKRVEIDWDNFDLEAFEARGRGKSPPKFNFQWKEHVYKPRPPPTPLQRAVRNAPREVHGLFAAYPETDSEVERERNGLPSPGSSVDGDAVQQPAANAPGTHHLISIPRPAPQPEGAAGHNEPDSREPMAGHASGSSTRHTSIHPTLGQPSASTRAPASPPWSRGPFTNLHRINMGKAPATRSGIERRQAPQSPEKRTSPLEKKNKKQKNNSHRTAQESGPEAKSLQGFLRSTRSSRRGGKCELWYLGDDGVATCSVNKR
ncbi:hypothetical protein CCMA1212_008253 [Trichoderma ghanense]|uniref:Uncharacterized protein n=1 Tax=Trichoderma ghanense TaxID=65468 RepID=A0ABY2GXN0_9HYPO